MSDTPENWHIDDKPLSAMTELELIADLLAVRMVETGNRPKTRIGIAYDVKRLRAAYLAALRDPKSDTGNFNANSLST